MSFLTLNHIHHTYFTKESASIALKDIHFTVDEGEFISLLGPSGCGKTTLLSIIAGLIKPTNGEVLIQGNRIDHTSSSIGYMLQQDYLFPWKTIEENIFIGLKILNILNEETKAYALNLLDEMGLSQVRNAYPRQLSGGMRQRAALVRTLATNPKILLLDEPFSALDYQTKLKLEDLVFNTLKQYKKTAILVTHDIGEAIAMSNRIVILSAQPGQLNKIISVPKALEELSPFHARQHELFPQLFQSIWKELDHLESKK